MNAADLRSKIHKILDMNAEKALINNIYFSPIYADRLAEKVPELNQLGFNLSKTETEAAQGTIVTGSLAAPSGEKLDLGSLLYDGKSVRVQKSLITVDTLLNFIEDNVPQEF
jgi:hypothetical protein